MIRAIQYGCGPIGCRVAEMAAERNDIQLVGAVDLDPRKVGRDLGEVAGLDRKLGVVVSDDAERLLVEAKPNLAFHNTGSSFKAVYDQLTGIVRASVNVVSTCEELSYPHRKEPGLAARLDELAKEHGVSVLGTGINPGFLMDAWPLFMTAPCREVKKIKAVRIQDATSRRLPFQKKIGAGTTVEQFHRLVEAGTLRHVGLAECTAMIAEGLGWQLTRITDTIEPILAERRVGSQHLTVEPGQVAGVRQIGRGFMGDREVIGLDFQAYLGAADPRDAVIITGTPDLEVVIKGGTHGDIGTAAVVVNAARRVVEAPAGLLTMKDLPPASCLRPESQAASR
jgi:hypothetical protein